jgi:hypothetical protein
VLWQEVLKNLYSDLCIVEDLVKGLEVGSFSSGHVADPLGIDSRKDSWLREKYAGDEKGRVSGRLFSTPNFLA